MKHFILFATVLLTVAPIAAEACSPYAPRYGTRDRTRYDFHPYIKTGTAAGLYPSMYAPRVEPVAKEELCNCPHMKKQHGHHEKR